MDLVVMELILWAALIFFFWALSDSLRRVESDIEALGLLKSGDLHSSTKHIHYVQPDKVIESIGTYKDADIYRYIVIAGISYQFEHVCPSDDATSLSEGQCCLAPGLIYGRIDTI
jgi:hypothetical protein